MARIILAGFWVLCAALLLWLAGCGPATKPEAEIAISINEVMASNLATCADEAGEYDDWIELFNSGGVDIDLDGYFISDDATDPFRRRLGSGLVVPAGATLLLWADADPEQGPHHLPFKLKATGEQVLLTSPDGVELDRLDYTDAVDDHVLARFPDAIGEPVWCDKATPDADNGAACGVE